MSGSANLPRMPGYQPVAVRPSSYVLRGHTRLKSGAYESERNSADDVTMSGKVDWWVEEVARERIVVAEDEKERLVRRRAARLAASEEQERRIRHHEIASAMDMVERMEERETAVRMEEAERRRRIKEIEDEQQAALLEQRARRSSALHSIVLERDRILASSGVRQQEAELLAPAVTKAMEREMQRRAASQMVLVSTVSSDDAFVSSAALLQAILGRGPEVPDPPDTEDPAKTVERQRSSVPWTGANSVSSPLVRPTPRTEFSRRVNPLGINNISMDLSQDWTGTSTMNSTQDSVLNPLTSFGSPMRMRGLMEEDSLLNKTQQSVVSTSTPALSVRVSELEVWHLPRTNSVAQGKCDCYLELRCGLAEGRTKAVRNSFHSKFEGVFLLPIAGEDDVIVAAREWDRSGVGKTLGSATISLEPLRRDGFFEGTVPLLCANGRQLLGHDGEATMLRLRMEDPSPASRRASLVLSPTSMGTGGVPAASAAGAAGEEALQRCAAIASVGVGVDADKAGSKETVSRVVGMPAADTKASAVSAERTSDKNKQQQLLELSDPVTRQLFQSAVAHSKANPRAGGVAAGRGGETVVPQAPRFQVDVSSAQVHLQPQVDVRNAHVIRPLQVDVSSAQVIQPPTVRIEQHVPLSSVQPSPASQGRGGSGWDTSTPSTPFTPAVGEALWGGGVDSAGVAGKVFKVTVVDAQNLPKMDSLGKCDAYVLASLGKLVQKTKTIKSNYNPTFGETLEFRMRRSGEELLVRVMDWHRMSKDTLIGTARLNLASLSGASQLPQLLPLVASDGSRVIGHNGKPALLHLNVTDEGYAEADGAEEAQTLPAAASPAAARDGESGGGSPRKSSLFEVKEKPPPGSASVRDRMAAFAAAAESSNNASMPSTPTGRPVASLTIGATPARAAASEAEPVLVALHRNNKHAPRDTHEVATSAKQDNHHVRASPPAPEPARVRATGEGDGPYASVQAAGSSHLAAAAAPSYPPPPAPQAAAPASTDASARPPKAPGPPQGVPGLGLASLQERDGDGRPVALKSTASSMLSPRSSSARSAGSRGSGRTPRTPRTPRDKSQSSARVSPRFELNDGEDVSNAAQRMIATIRQRLATSRTSSEGSLVSREDVPVSPRSSAISPRSTRSNPSDTALSPRDRGDEKLQFV